MLVLIAHRFVTKAVKSTFGLGERHFLLLFYHIRFGNTKEDR